MAVRSLAYIRVETRDLAAWRSFAEGVVGAAAAPDSNDERLLLRLDGRPWRFCIEKGEQERYVAAGLECPDEEQWQATVDRLKAAGVALEQADAATIAQRHVRGMVSLADPAGNRIELVWGNIVAGTPFVSPAGVPASPARWASAMSWCRPAAMTRRGASTRNCSASATATRCASSSPAGPSRAWA
jgi:3,4-dihydroxy-9,10-secoandrosta-1,3,5(10)-triene-9,17-dione 4,5-dioxygenase